MDVNILLPWISVIVALLSLSVAWRREAKKNDQKGAAEIAMIMEKLANISLGIAELKEGLSTVMHEQNDMRVEIAELKTSVKSAHNRIDNLMKIN